MNGTKILLVISVAIFLLVIGPALFIWGANELLEQAGSTHQIPWNFWTWLAAFLVMPKSAGFKS
jgi:hypothetical protein